MRTPRFLVSLMAGVVVLALVSVVLMAHGWLGVLGGVTASTPPDAVHVVVTKGSMQPTSTQPIIGTVYDHTFTDATMAQRLQTDMNAPASTAPGDVAPTCPADASTPDGRDFTTYDFMFTAQGQTIEHAMLSMRCGRIGVRSGFAPTLTLGAEHSAPEPHILFDILNTTYFSQPHEVGSPINIHP